jgi:nucleotide-binding universal stress UspA family protein
METIVVGIDTELPSRTALQWVIERTATAPARVRLVTVTGDRPFSTRRAERDLRNASAGLAAARPGIETESELLDGAGIAEALAADAMEADLLVVGHHRRRILRSLLAGALPMQIAAHAACPVMIVPEDWLRRFGKVVVGVEPDGSSDSALEFAAHEAARSGYTLDIVRVAFDSAHPGSSLTTPLPDPRDARSPEMVRLVESVGSVYPSLAVRTYSATGDPDRILRAHGRQAAVVVVGSHGRGAISGLLHGSRAYDLMNWSKAPLCVVPAGWHARRLEETA